MDTVMDTDTVGHGHWQGHGDRNGLDIDKTIIIIECCRRS